MGRVRIGQSPSDVWVTTHHLKEQFEGLVKKITLHFHIHANKNPDLEGRAEEILDVLFSKTLHSGYWSPSSSEQLQNSLTEVTAF